MSSDSQQNSLSFSSSSSSKLPIPPSLSPNPSCSQKISLCQSFLNSLINNPIYHPFLSFNQFSYGLFDYSYIVGWRNNGTRYARYDNGQFENGLKWKMDEIRPLEPKIEQFEGKLGKGEGNNQRKEKSVDEKGKKRRKKKGFNFEIFISSLKKIFIEVSDYLLLDDPLQQVCSQGLSQIKIFQKNYKNHLHCKKSLSSPSPSPSLYARYSNPTNQISQDSQQTHSHSHHPHSQSLPFYSSSFRPSRSFSHTFKQQLEFAFYLKNYEHDEQMLMEIGKVCGILREQKANNENGNCEEGQGEFLLCFGDSDLWKALIRRQGQ